MYERVSAEAGLATAEDTLKAEPICRLRDKGWRRSREICRNGGRNGYRDLTAELTVRLPETSMTEWPTGTVGSIEDANEKGRIVSNRKGQKGIDDMKICCPDTRCDGATIPLQKVTDMDTIWKNRLSTPVAVTVTRNEAAARKSIGILFRADTMAEYCLTARTCKATDVPPCYLCIISLASSYIAVHTKHTQSLHRS
jgi:hypothetical protein